MTITCTPLREVEPSLDLRPLLRYRHLCAQLVGGIVAGDDAVIARAEEVRDELGRWSSYLGRQVNDDAGTNALAYELAGADGMSVALDIHQGVSAHIEAEALTEPMYVERTS